MNSIASLPIDADVRPSETLDGLVVSPRRPDLMYDLRGAIRDALPGVQVQRRPDGLWVSSIAAPKLLSGVVGLNLRWEPEARRFAENREWARRVHPRVFAEVRRIQAGGRTAAEAHLAHLEDRDVLDDHQWENVAAMTLADGFGLCVFDEQGAGKTVTQIFAYDVLVDRDEADMALIVAPKSMVPEWPRDFRNFKGELYRVAIVTGTRKQKEVALRSGADVFVTNFETAVSMEDELRALVQHFEGRAILVVDESFYAKNLDARRTRALRRLREWCRRAYVLCGTPAPNSPHDLVQQFNLVDFGLTFDGVVIPEDREQARPVVQRAIEERGLFIRHLKEDVLPDLPAKRFNKILVDMQPVQSKAYAAALNNLILDLRATTDENFGRQIASFLARRSALLQVCSNPVSIVDGYQEVPAKLLALDQILQEAIIRRGEKVVLWSFYTASIDALVARYSRFRPARYDGTVNDVAERREAVRRFQEDAETMLFIGNPAAAGAGLTLHRARLAIYESMSNQAAHYLQSLDRIHRRGQTRPVEYLILLCDRTIELQEYDRLVAKERAAQQLLKDEVTEPVTRETMLRELETDLTRWKLQSP